MGEYLPNYSSLPKGVMEQQSTSNLASPKKNPLAVASLTSPLLPTSSSSSSSPSTKSTITQDIAPSRSQPFSCPSLDETLLVHGAAAPAQTPKFRLQMRQEPIHGLAVGNDESAFKNARVTPLDPPPICELVPERNTDVRFISVPELSVQACLVYSESPFAAVANSSKDKDPMMSGLQECGFIAPISGRHEECLFVFSELGIRTAGEYRIRFDLIDRLDSQFRRLTSIYTQSFTVYADKKNFPGLSTSTELIHSLVRRGLKLRIIKSQSGKQRKRKKLGRDSTEVASASGQSITPSPSHYHRQPQGQLQYQHHHQQQQSKLIDSNDHQRDYRQQHPPYSPSEWPSHSYRQHSHPFLNPPQPQHVSQLHGPSNPSAPHHMTRSHPYHDEETSDGPTHHTGYTQQRHLPPYPIDVKKGLDITPSLSPSTGSKSSTDSAPSVSSTPDEEHRLRRLAGPPHLNYLTPRSQPHPIYNNENREEDAINRPFRTLPTSTNTTPLIHQNDSSQDRSNASFSRLDLPPPRPSIDSTSRNRPILPPIRSFGSSSPSRLSKPSR